MEDKNKTKKYAEILKFKENGKFHYKTGQFSEALICFTEGINYDPEISDLKAKLYKNRAAVYLSLKNFKEAERDANFGKNLQNKNKIDQFLHKFAANLKIIKHKNAFFFVKP